MTNQFYFLSNGIVYPGCGIYSVESGQSASSIDIAAIAAVVGFTPSALFASVRSGGSGSIQIETATTPIYLGPGDSIKISLSGDNSEYTFTIDGASTIVCYP